jgi:hypothetical protein
MATAARSIPNWCEGDNRQNVRSLASRAKSGYSHAWGSDVNIGSITRDGGAVDAKTPLAVSDEPPQPSTRGRKTCNANA